MAHLQHPAAGDCERLRPGFFAQPMNTLSSLAYAVAGGGLCIRATGRADAAPGLASFGLLVAANGLGGVAFHGPGGRVGHWIHDTALAGTVAGVATQALTLVRTPPTPAARRRLIRAAALMTVAALVNGLGRTGGPICRPDSRVQAHAVWHVLTAAALYDWGVATLEPGPPPT